MVLASGMWLLGSVPAARRCWATVTHVSCTACSCDWHVPDSHTCPLCGLSSQDPPSLGSVCVAATLAFSRCLFSCALIRVLPSPQWFSLLPDSSLITPSSHFSVLWCLCFFLFLLFSSFYCSLFFLFVQMGLPYIKTLKNLLTHISCKQKPTRNKPH